MPIEWTSYQIVLIITHFAISVLFLYLGVSSLFSIRKDNKTQISKIAFMCFTSAVLTLSLMIGVFPIVNTNFGNHIYLMGWGSGMLSYYFYISAVQFFLDIKSPTFNYFKKLYLVAISFYLVDIPFYFLFDWSFMNQKMDLQLSILHQILNFGLEPNAFGFLIQIVSGLSFLVCVFYIFKKLINDKKEERLLFVGLCISILGLANDTTLASGLFIAGFPLTFLGNIFEGIRLTTYYQIENRNKVEEIRDELSKVAKAAQVGLIAGSIAHDIKGPLSVILGSSSIMRDDIIRESHNSPRREKLLNSIDKSANRINSVVSCYMSLLHHERLENTEQTYLKELIDESIETVGTRIKEAHLMVNVDVDDSVLVECHRSEMIMAIANLIGNSCDELKEKEDAWIKVSSSQEEDFFFLRFTDSGSGIKEEIQKRIFEMQFTTKRSGEGTGLGLGIVKEILNRRGCDIFLDTESENTSFVIQFPLSYIS